MSFLQRVATKTILVSANALGLRNAVLELLLPETIPTTGQVLVAGAPTTDVVPLGWADPGAGAGAEAFTDLTDTPSAYAGQALQLVRVNTGTDALEFVAPSSLTFDAGVTIGADQAVSFPSSDYPLVESNLATYGLPQSVSSTPGAVMVVSALTGPGGVNVLETTDALLFREIAAGTKTLQVSSDTGDEVELLLRTGSTDMFVIASAGTDVEIGRAGAGSGLAIRNNGNLTKWPTTAGSVGAVLGLTAAGQLGFTEPVYGSELATVSVASATRDATSYATLTGASLTVGAVPAGTYALSWSATARRLTGGQGFRMRVYDGTTVLWEIVKEALNTQDRVPCSGLVHLTDPAGLTLSLQAATYGAGAEIQIDNITMEFARRS